MLAPIVVAVDLTRPLEWEWRRRILCGRVKKIH